MVIELSHIYLLELWFQPIPFLPVLLIDAHAARIAFQQLFFHQHFLQWLTQFLPPLLTLHLISGV